MTGKLFVFEGPDGVGKTSITRALGDNCDRSKFELLTFPGKEAGTLGRVIYDIHHEPSKFGIEKMSPLAKQALHIAAHLDLIENRIRPVLAADKNILLDRFWWSTIVYGEAGGSEIEPLKQLVAAERLVWGDIYPEIVFVVDRDKPIDRSVNMAEWTKLREAYRRLATQEKSFHEVTILENSTALDDATNIAREAIRARTAY